MQILYQASKILAIVAFLGYGLSCLFAGGMVADFERFGLSRFRRLTGGLELLGALALLAGYAAPLLVIAASAGLTVLMLLGLLVRIRAGDPLWEALPATFLLLVNCYILIYALRVATAV